MCASVLSILPNRTFRVLHLLPFLGHLHLLPPPSPQMRTQGRKGTGVSMSVRRCSIACSVEQYLQYSTYSRWVDLISGATSAFRLSWLRPCTSDVSFLYHLALACCSCDTLSCKLMAGVDMDALCLAGLVLSSGF